MSNPDNLEAINSVCTTSEKLIESKVFMRWVIIILKQAKIFDENYILSLFTKLQNNETLNDEEKEGLKSFVSDPIVSKLWQELLSKLRKRLLNVSINNTNDLISFSKLLDNIFAKDWFKKLQSYILEKVALTLNTYQWMTKIKIELKWEKKEVYMDNENLKVDSSRWEKIEIDWEKVKINPERDIIEYLEWELAWEQLFTWHAAMRELEKQWKRLPLADDNNQEFQAIIKEIWIENFNKLFPGFLGTGRGRFFGRGNRIFLNVLWERIGILSLWSASSHNEDEAYYISIANGRSDFTTYSDNKSKLFSARWLK